MSCEAHHNWRRANCRAMGACFVVLICVFPSSGDEGLTARVEDLVRRLDSAIRAERIQAE